MNATHRAFQTHRSSDQVSNVHIRNNQTLRFILLYRWPWLWVMVGLSLLSAVVGLAAPFFQKVFVDYLTNINPQTQYGNTALARIEAGLFSLHPLWILLAAFVTMLVAQWIGSFASWLGIREALKRQKILGEVVYNKTLSLRQDQTMGQTVGEVVSIYATDVTGSTSIVDQTIPLGAGVLFPFLCAPIAVRLICGIPVGVTTLVMVFVIVASIVFSTRQARFFQIFKKLAADRTGLVNEWVQNIRLLRILGWVDSFEMRIFAKRREETVNRIHMVTNGQMMGAFSSSINFFLNLIAVMALVSLKGVSASPGDYFALLWIFGAFLSRPFRQVPWIFTWTFDGWTSIKRVEAFLRRHPESLKYTLSEYASFITKQNTAEVSTVEPNRKSSELKSPSRIQELGKHGLKVEHLNLEVASGNEKKHLLDDVSFEVLPGEFAAIVGEVGSGKTLLLMSLLGETGATVKSLQIGEIELSQAGKAQRHRYFGFVPQDGFVMSGNLRENIVFRYYAGPEFDPGVLRALHAAQFDPASEGLSNGLLTEFGERGVNLSGGQKQRVGLARSAYLLCPVILIDDALSAVDVETERLLLETLLFGEWKAATRLMVTHRLSVLERVDRIFFMSGGRLCATGTLKELTSDNKQFRDFISTMGLQDSRQQADSEL